MEKEQNPKTEEKINNKKESPDISENNEEEIEVKTTPEDKIKELEDKLVRTLAEMENQRRRFEKEKDDAFEYGGFSFAKESLNLIDNFDRAKQSLENDEKIKDSNVFKKTLEHLELAAKLDAENIEILNDLMNYYLKAPIFLGGDSKKASKINSKIEKIKLKEN